LKTKSDYHRLIVNCFCDFEKGLYGAKLNEAIEVYDRYPDPEFWDWMIINCDIKVQSLKFFLSADGTEYIQQKHKLMNAKESKKCFTNVGSSDKVGKDRKYKKKNMTVLDFIRNGKKKED
tara:strand:- start:2341 stop:2700 length:360 start_codon:yes stop_codon:yes gene_type:complete